MTDTTSPTALDLLKRAEALLSALHGSVARHDNLAASLGCAGCELRDQISAALPSLAAAPAVLPPVADRAAVEQTQESTPEQVVRDHVTTLHLIGEQLAGVESWMWEHLADVRDVAVTEQPQCDAEFVGGGTCAKPAGHRPPGSDDPHVPTTPPAVVAEPGKENDAS